MQESSGRSTPIAAFLAIAGGVLLASGSFLEWAKISGGGTIVEARGTDIPEGWIVFGAGIVGLAAAITSLVVHSRRLRAGWAAATLGASLVGLAVGLYDVIMRENRVADYASKELSNRFGGTPSQIRSLVDAAIDIGRLSTSIRIGLYIVIAGGALGVVGGFLGMRGSSAAVPAMPTMGTMAPTAPAVAPPMAPPPMPEPPAPGGSVEGDS